MIEVFGHELIHLLGENATHPIELRWRGLGALFVLAGMGLRRPHAYPVHPSAAHSGAFTCGF